MSTRDFASRKSADGPQRSVAAATGIRHAHHATTPLKRSVRGVTSIEYALIAALIAIVIFLAVQGLGGAVSNLFNQVATCSTNLFHGC